MPVQALFLCRKTLSSEFALANPSKICLDNERDHGIRGAYVRWGGDKSPDIPQITGIPFWDLGRMTL
jgi:hypothetical protein